MKGSSLNTLWYRYSRSFISRTFQFLILVSYYLFLLFKKIEDQTKKPVMMQCKVILNNVILIKQQIMKLLKIYKYTSFRIYFN